MFSGPGSLLSELKSRGWVNTLVGGQKSGSKVFSISISLWNNAKLYLLDINTLILCLTDEEHPVQYRMRTYGNLKSTRANDQ